MITPYPCFQPARYWLWCTSLSLTAGGNLSAQWGLLECCQGMWRTPHPSPSPFVNGTKGLSGAVAIAMQYNRDGTIVFTERPHGSYSDGLANPLIVNVRLKALLACE